MNKVKMIKRSPFDYNLTLGKEYEVETYSCERGAVTIKDDLGDRNWLVKGQYEFVKLKE